MKLPVDYDSLTSSERRKVRTAYINLQKGLCSHCGNRLNAEPREDILKMKIKKKLFPENFFSFPIHLHHSHKSGMTIGAVHSICNAVLWQFHGE